MNRWFLLIFLSLLSAAASSSQQPAGSVAPESPELRALREKYRQLIAETESSAAEQRRAGLLELERRRAEAGDYEGARRVRELLREDAGKAAATADSRKTLVLQGSKGSTSGSAVTQGDGVQLNRDGAAVEWSLSSFAPGRYEVILRGGVEDFPGEGRNNEKRAAGGPLKDQTEVGVVRAAMKTDAARRSGNEENAGGVIAFELVSGIDKTAPLYYHLTASGTWADARDFNLGIVEVKGSIATFRARAEIADKKGLLHLTEVRLVPKAAQSASTTDHEFESYREKYLAAEKDRSRTVDREWLERLDKLEAGYSAAGNAAGIAKVQEERKRLLPGGPRVLLVNDPLFCKTRGDIRLTNSKEFLTRLRPGSQITWDLTRGGVTPGEWEVTINAMVGPDHGGEGVLASGDSTVEVQLNSPSPPEDRRKPKTDSGASTTEPPKPVMKEISAGTLRIPAGQRELALRIVRTVHTDGGLFDLKSITLKPAAGK